MINDQDLDDVIEHMALGAQAFLALVTLRAERDELKSQLAKCPCSGGGTDTARLLLSEDFAGEKLNSPHLEFFSSTPEAYTCDVPYYTTHEGKTCGHYFAQKGTNEKTPWEVTISKNSVPQLAGGNSFSEICFEWQEYFVGGYSWPSSGQKMFRMGFDDSTMPESKKSFDLACLNSGANLQAAAYWTGDDGGTDEWFVNSGERHPEDRWVTWRVWMNLNNAGQSDGFVRVYRDGTHFTGAENLTLRLPGDARGWNYWWLGGNYSNFQGEVLKGDGHRYITGIRWWNKNPDA